MAPFYVCFHDETRTAFDQEKTVMPGMDLEFFFYRLIGSFPILLMYLAGAVMCIVYARNNPRASVLVAVAIAISLVTRFVFPFVSVFIFSLLSGADTMSDIAIRNVLQSFVYSIPHALTWGLLLWAVFKTRPRDARPSAEFLLQQETESTHRSG